MNETGRKDDQEKNRWDLLPFRAVSATVRVLTLGAKRYGPENWRQVENRRARYFAAALRHMSAWWLGEKLDPDSGESHLAHAACSILFLLDEDGIEKTGLDGKMCLFPGCAHHANAYANCSCHMGFAQPAACPER